MNITAVKASDRMVESISSVSWVKSLTTDSTRLERSPGANFLKKVVGRDRRRVISGVCRANSVLSFILTTKKLRESCTVTRPTAALNIRTAMGTSCEASPEGMTSLNRSLQINGVTIVRSTTPRQAIRAQI